MYEIIQSFLLSSHTALASLIGVHLFIGGGFWSTLGSWASDLNPAKYVCDIPGVGGVCSAVSTTTSILTDPFGWFIGQITSFLDRIFKDINSALALVWAVPGGFTNFYSSMAPTGVVIAGVAGGARVLRGAFDPRQEGMALIVDNMTRFGIATLAIVSGGVVEQGMTFIINNFALVGVLAAENLTGAGFAGVNIFQAIISIAINIPTSLFMTIVWVVLAIGLIVGILYVIGLWIGRAIMMAFCFATAPICLAIAVYDQKNKFVTWWAEMFLGIAIMPIVIFMTLGVTCGYMVHIFLTLPVIGPLVAMVFPLGGIWFMGKVINKLVWSGFSHGSAFGAITAASAAAMAIPSAMNDISILGRMGSGGKLMNSAEAMGKGKKPNILNKAMDVMDKGGAARIAQFGSTQYGVSSAMQASSHASMASKASSYLSPQQSAEVSKVGDTESFSRFAQGLATQIDPNPNTGGLVLQDPQQFASLAAAAYVQQATAPSGGGPSPLKQNPAAAIRSAAQTVSSSYLNSPGGEQPRPRPATPPIRLEEPA